MADSTEPIRIELELPSDDDRLLAGLDAWLQLGLISQEQVRSFCGQRLSCPRPPVENPFTSPAAIPEVALEPSASASSDGDDLPETPPSESPPARSLPAPVRGWMGQLMGELSVVWLLGLGVFLVVLSSAVLAATQWAQFNPVGQYLVLFTYTLLFWGAGLWSARHAQLPLTAKTLQIITLLLIPLNVWAMDGLGVWRGSGALVGGVALAALGGVAERQLRRWSATPLQRGLFLGWGLLHLGWGWDWMPGIAVYGAAVSGASQLRRPGAAWPQRLLGFALALLLLRGLVVLDPSGWGQLSLAFGVYGASWVWRGLPPLPSAAETDTETGPEIEAAPASMPAPWGRRLGQALLWWGWLLAIENWPAQAFAVSGLGLGLRLYRLGRWPQRRQLLAAFAIALQLAFVGWRLLPLPWRQVLIAPPMDWLQPPAPTWLLGISLYPYVVLLVAAADRYYRRGQASLARFSEGVALGFNGLLTAFSIFAPAVLVVNLVASSITALLTTRRRPKPGFWRVLSSHGLLVVTVLVAVDHRWPQFDRDAWMLIVFGLMAANWLLRRWLPPAWGRSAWLLGLGLAGLAYGLLWDHLLERQFQSSYSLLGLSIPLLLTLQQRPRWSLAATGLTAPLTLGLGATRLAGLGTATGLAAANSYVRSQLPMVLATVGLGLGFTISLIEDGLPGFPSRYDQWFAVLALLVAGLWGLWWGLDRSRSARWRLYRRACDLWGLALTLGLLLGLTVDAAALYGGLRPPHLADGVAAALLTGALLGRFWQRPQPRAVYLIGSAVELLAVEIVAWQGGDRLVLALVTIGLGAATLALTAGRWRPPLIPHLWVMTLLYGLLALLLRVDFFTAWSGGSVLAVALLGLEVSRQAQWRWLRWLALAGITLGWYELVLYQLSLATGEHPADGLVVLAAVAAVLMAVYRGAAVWRDRVWGVSNLELLTTAHLHWGIAVALLTVSAQLVYESGLGLLLPALGLILGLVGYALLQGRIAAAANPWIYGGLTLLAAGFAYWRLAMPALAVLDDWWGAVACGFGGLFFWGPWGRWGWPLAPWRRFAIALPPAITLLAGSWEHSPTLWILAGFYAGLAWTQRQVRLSYLSAGCAVWAIWIWLEEQSISDSLAYILPLGLTGLYAAQLDPGLQAAENREGRHWLRVLSLGLILGVALFSDPWTGLPVGAASLAALALGLRGQVRAYLYVGTVVFGLNALNQLIWLNAEFPLVKWMLGLLLGMTLIWVAANFERSRQRWLDLTQNWLQELQTWE